MAGKPGVLPEGIRLSDIMSVMVLARVIPMDRINKVLAESGKASVRERNLPAYLMVYYVVALWLYRSASYQEVLRCIFEAFDWAEGRIAVPTISGKAAIVQARTRLGAEPLEKLCKVVAVPIASSTARGAYWNGWRIASLDGSTLDVADTELNDKEFGRAAVSRGGGSAHPKLRFCSLIENGTHALFGTAIGSYATSELTLAIDVLESLEPGMVCLADRHFYGFEMWSKAVATGADLVWRVKKNAIFPVTERLPDGSYLSESQPSGRKDTPDQRMVVRVVEYKLDYAEEDSDKTIYRLVTTILDHEKAPAIELAALYNQRWEIETTLDEFKTHLGGRDLVLRSKTPEGVKQEFWGFILAHHAVRSIMNDAAQKVEAPPTTLSFVHSLNEVKRKLPMFLVLPPSGLAQKV